MYNFAGSLARHVGLWARPHPFTLFNFRARPGLCKCKPLTCCIKRQLSTVCYQSIQKYTVFFSFLSCFLHFDEPHSPTYRLVRKPIGTAVNTNPFRVHYCRVLSPGLYSSYKTLQRKTLGLQANGKIPSCHPTQSIKALKILYVREEYKINYINL